MQVRFADPAGGPGICAWKVSGVATAELDGLATEVAAPPAAVTAIEHPIGALAIDHLVVFTADLERTVASFEAAGVRCRRRREGGPSENPLQQAFFRLGEVIVEAVQVPAEQAGPGGAARFWGLTVTVEDLEGACEMLGPLVGTARDAVQPGRRIATMRRQAGLGLPVALISPPP